MCTPAEGWQRPRATRKGTGPEKERRQAPGVSALSQKDYLLDVSKEKALNGFP